MGNVERVCDERDVWPRQPLRCELHGGLNAGGVCFGRIRGQVDTEREMTTPTQRRERRTAQTTVVSLAVVMGAAALGCDGRLNEQTSAGGSGAASTVTPSGGAGGATEAASDMAPRCHRGFRRELSLVRSARRRTGALLGRLWRECTTVRLG